MGGATDARHRSTRQGGERRGEEGREWRGEERREEECFRLGSLSLFGAAGSCELHQAAIAARDRNNGVTKTSCEVR